MYEIINQIIIRRDSLPIIEVDSLINEVRDNLNTNIYASELSIIEDFFDLETDFFTED